jgi:hypothetical protein
MKTSILVFTDDSVSLSIIKDGQGRDREYIGCGTLLTSLLNLDYDIISKVVGMYTFTEKNYPLYLLIDAGMKLETILDPQIPPNNKHQIFDILMQYHDVFGFLYTEDDWIDIIVDLFGGTKDGITYESSAQEHVNSAKEIIDASMTLPNSRLYNFYLYLSNCGIMQPSPVDPPVIHTEFKKKGRYCPSDFPDYAQYLDHIFQDFLTFSQSTIKETSTYTFSDGQTLAEDDHFRFVLSASIQELARRKKSIRKCEICKNYFVPPLRSDTKYCELTCPEDETMTCREYAAKKLAYQRQQSDELKRVAKKVSNDKNRRARENGGIDIYKLTKQYFLSENRKKAEAFDKGEITAEEYREWLNEMLKRKIIPEARSYNSEDNAPVETEEE